MHAARRTAADRMISGLPDDERLCSLYLVGLGPNAHGGKPEKYRLKS